MITVTILTSNIVNEKRWLKCSKKKKALAKTRKKKRFWLFFILESTRKTKTKGEDRDQETREDHTGNINPLFTPPSLPRDFGLGQSTNEQNQKYKLTPKQHFQMA